MNKFTPRDQIFDKPLKSVKAFQFDAEVTEVFDDMINRSVPGYPLLMQLTALFSEVFVTPDSQIYDLGCSTGMITRVISEQVKTLDNITLHAIDNSMPMIEKCRAETSHQHIHWQCSDISDVEIYNASFVVLNLTLQFIPPENRKALLEKIFHGLNPGGALMLTEKQSFESDKDQAMNDLYHGYKKIRGYSDLEIAHKRNALEKVLIPDSEQQHYQRLEESGFNDVFQVFHCFNFASYLAIKNA